MTVVYLDAFLVLNFVVNYLLLACAGKLDGEPVGRGRTALAAALGAAYGGLALLPDWGWWPWSGGVPRGQGGCWGPLWGCGASSSRRL